MKSITPPRPAARPHESTPTAGPVAAPTPLDSPLGTQGGLATDEAATHFAATAQPALVVDAGRTLIDPDSDADLRGVAVPRGGARMLLDDERLRDLLGRVPLREIVRGTTDRIERYCIAAALELTRGNRASAAAMLGLSRQSLYVKLRRFGMADRAPARDR